ncbi:octopamine receptor beta-2R [Hydra vulgaris]|uniref:octopamine receptor beta-2R n=1 Tax=Hydra vulgaris TaxID=6087 RepID=UPI001F5FADF5|nr:octopamine receptor beta-2R [Hydra vulgaris]
MLSNNSTVSSITISNSSIPSTSTALPPDVAIPLATCFILIIIASILFNTILIFVILSERHLQTITNVYIINLAVGDMLLAIAVVPFDADFMLRGYYPYGTVLCGIKEVLFIFSLPSAVFNLFLLTLERFVSVYFPFKRIQYFSKKNVFISISFSWIYTINVGLFPIYYNGPSAIKVVGKVCQMEFSNKFAIYLISVNFVLPVLIMVSMYFSLFLLAHKHQKQIQRLSINSLRKQSNSFQKNLKAAKTIFLLVGNFLVCWVSFIGIALSNLICGGCHPRELTWISNVVNYSNIVFNPIIYGMLNKTIRKAIYKKLFQIFSCFCKTHYQNYIMRQIESNTSCTYNSPGVSKHNTIGMPLTLFGKDSHKQSYESEADTLL